MSRIIPKYHDYDMIGRIRMDASIVLANSDPVLLSRGLIDSAVVIHKFGSIVGVGTGLTPVSQSGTYQTPQTAQTLEIVSDSANDNGSTSPLGSGATKVKIYGIRAWTNGEETEEVTLNGQTPVAVTGTWLRVYRVKVIESGTYASTSAPSHNSTITLKDTNSPQGIWATITSIGGFGEGQTQIALFSVPSGFTAFVPHIDMSVESNKNADIVFFYRPNADVVAAPYGAMQSQLVLKEVETEAPRHPFAPLGPFLGPCDIGFMAKASASGTADVSIDFELLCFEV